jgi:hypothetical protein
LVSTGDSEEEDSYTESSEWVNNEVAKESDDDGGDFGEYIPTDDSSDGDSPVGLALAQVAASTDDDDEIVL